jgi:hypothetical protein
MGIPSNGTGKDGSGVKVSERSWHLRYARLFKGEDYIPRDLCGYFWTVMLWLAFPAVMLGTVGVSLWAVGSEVYRHPTEWAVIAGCSVILTALFFGVCFAYQSVTRAVRRRQHTAGAPSLLAEYVKAKKRRLCPLIEVVE